MAVECFKSELIERLGQVVRINRKNQSTIVQFISIFLFQFPAIDLEDIQSDLNNNSDAGSIKSEASSLSLKSEKSGYVQKSAKIEASIRKISTLAKDSTFYDDKVVVQLSAGKDVTRSKNSSFYGGSCDVKDVQSGLISSTRKRPAPVQSTNKVMKSIDTDKNIYSVFDFDASDDDEPVAKKPRGKGRGRGRGRGRRPAQPKKRAKPAAFPRVKLPSFERGEKKFTVRAKTPVGLSAKVLKAAQTSKVRANQMPSVDLAANDGAAKKRTLRERKKTCYATVITSGMDKLGAAIKTHLLVCQQPIGKKGCPKKATPDSVRKFVFSR